MKTNFNSNKQIKFPKTFMLSELYYTVFFVINLIYLGLYSIKSNFNASKNLKVSEICFHFCQDKRLKIFTYVSLRDIDPCE